MKKGRIRLAVAQINCTVGDLEGNAKKITDYLAMAEGLGADIISFPELSVTGYPPEDLLLKPKFVEDNLKQLRRISGRVKDTAAIVGFVDRKGGRIYNAAAVIYKGKTRGIYHKMLLPNYGVFDEKRYFESGDKPLVFSFGKFVFGVNICEDLWHEAGPVKKQAALGAKIIFNINASPYYAGKIKKRQDIIKAQARPNRIYVCYNNLVGGQDELVFDGQSLIVDSRGGIAGNLAAFKEDLLVLDISLPESRKRDGKNVITITNKLPEKQKPALHKRQTRFPGPVAEIYEALVLGLHDYIVKNGFQKVVIGLSGGIDSSLVAAIAVDALGKDNAIGIFMPSQYSSAESKNDALKLAENLRIRFINVPIEGIFAEYTKGLASEFSGLKQNIAEENLQARIRGTLLMAFSNKFGWIVLATGNKSEMSTGYATLYGDMAGGFAVIKDVPKTLVYKLSLYRNTLGAAIPENVLIKAPTAELKPDQKDTDSLPEYATLDPVLKAYIEEDKDLKMIASLGFDREVAAKVLNMVDKSEYKRRQSPPGIKITPKAFGRDRRMPITNKYKG